MLNDAAIGNGRIVSESAGVLTPAGGSDGRGPCRDDREAGIIDRLKVICAGRSAAVIGGLSGTHAETARRYLNGASTPNPAFLAALCDAFGVSEAWLLCGRGETYRDGGPHRVHVTPREALVAVRAALCELQARLTALESMLEYPKLNGSAQAVGAEVPRNGLVGGKRSYRPATTPEANGADARAGSSLALRQRA